MAYITTKEYTETLYSQENNHDLKIFFDDVELEDADLHCERLTIKSRITPDDSKKTFYLDNFISKELTLVLHNVDLSKIKGKVNISIGTLVGDAYEYVPIGIFNIQDKPTTDGNTTTIILRDNSVLFDFNYNAKSLIDENGGTATKMQILKDICSKVGVVCNIEDFIGATDEVGIYDSTITARTYIAYLAEQAGAIATINRTGDLIFVYINNLYKHRIPLSIVEKYEKGDKYSISRVVYEDAIRKFQNPLDDEIGNDTLYINSANPYISSQEQVDSIFNIVNGFEIDSFTTGKILGNPSIDSYDLIEIYDDYTEEETVISTTLANHNLIYNGVFTAEYKTVIGLEAKQENVSLIGEANFRKYAKTSIDNINNDIEIIVGEQNEQKDQITQMIIDINSIQNLFQITGGINLIRNSVGFFGEDYWVKSDEGTFGFGEDNSLFGKTTSSSKISIQNGTLTSSTSNITGLTLDVIKSLNFKLRQDEDVTTTVKLYGLSENNPLYQKTFTGKMDWEEIYNADECRFFADNTNLTLVITSTSTYDGKVDISDLMLNDGETQSWQPANGEVWGTVIKMSQMGISCYSVEGGYVTMMTTQGFEVRNLHGNTIGDVITRFTILGLETNDITQTGKHIQKNLVHDMIESGGNEVYVEYIKE